MARTLYPKDYIRDVLIGEIKDIMDHGHAYLSFALMCAGIDCLGRCIDDQVTWHKVVGGGKHFKLGVSLFPPHYHSLADPLYTDLRCGLLHAQRPGGVRLTEQKNGPFDYKDHLISNDRVIVVEHFYTDFASACNKVLATQFAPSSKMNQMFLYVS